MLTLLVGGARSGKSSLAVEMGRRHHGSVAVIATAEPFDDDLRTRIAQHRADRPPAWPVVEVPVDLAAAIGGAPGHDPLLIVDCLTVWLANLFAHGEDEPARARRADDLVAALAARAAPTVVVSNEVGLGIVPDSALARSYRDELGRLNQRVAASADRVLFLSAGRAVRLDDPWTVLG